MARYKKIYPKMYGDEKFRRLSAPQPNGQTLFQYLIAGPQTTNVPGLYSIGEAGLAEKLRWPLEAFREVFAEVIQEGLAKYDPEALVVSVPNAIAYDEPASPNVVKSWKTSVDEVPECEIKREHLKYLREHMKREGFDKGFLEAFDKGFTESRSRSLTRSVVNMSDRKKKREKKLQPVFERIDELQELADHHADLFGKAHTKVVGDDHIARILKVLDKYGMDGCKLIQEGHRFKNGTDSRYTGWPHAYPFVRVDGKRKKKEPNWPWIEDYRVAGAEARKKARGEDEWEV